MNQTRALFFICTFFLLAGCKERVDTLHAGALFNCATHGDEVSCWGLFANFRGSGVEERGWELSPLGYIRQQFIEPKVAVGYSHFCVLDQGQVECFLDNGEGQTDVPELTNAYEVATGEDFSCALDETGLVCWGDTGWFTGHWGEGIPDDLDSPSLLVAGKSHICLKDNNGFYCDGFSWMGDGNPAPPEFVTSPSQVTTSAETGITCAKQNEWICWSDSSLGYADAYFDTPEADIVVPGFQQTCALTDGDVTCKGYGIIGPVGVPVPTTIRNAWDIDIAGVHACAINGLGVTCWGPEVLGIPVNVPPYL